MKKRVPLLLILFLTLFSFCGRVEAADDAEELVCVYKSGNFSYVTMLTQDTDGNIKFFYINDEIKNITTVERNDWEQPTDDFSIEFDTDYYNDVDGVLTSCPKYATSYTLGSKSISFHDDKAWNRLDYDLVDKLSSPNVSLPTIAGGKSEFQDEIDNTKWRAVCAYTDSSGEMLYLYFNSNKFIFDNKRKHVLSSTAADFDASKLSEYYEEYSGCPVELYEQYHEFPNDYNTCILPTSFPTKYYIDKPIGVYNIPTISGNCSIRSRLITLSYDPSNSSGFGETPTENHVIIKSCKDLLGDKLIEKIGTVMNWVKIIIPILLIVMGTIDFTKAVFSGKDDDMAKSRKTFIMRIVAAILVFLAPIFVNLILTIANEVWSYISPDACIEVNK